MTIALPFAVIPLDLGTITTGNERAERPASHLGEFKAPGLIWGSNGNTDLWVRGDRGASFSGGINFVSLLGANATSSTTIRVRLGDSQAEVDGAADYDSGVVAFINPTITRDDGLYSSHLEIGSLQTERWWRIDIGSHASDFEVSMLVIGEKITPANYYAPGWQRGFEDLGNIDWSPLGVTEEEEGLIYRLLTMRLGWLSESEYETKFGPLMARLGKRGVALWCFDPTSSLYRQSKTYFGWLRNALVATHARDTPAGIRYDQEFEILSMF